jgi:hypothetical protein
VLVVAARAAPSAKGRRRALVVCHFHRGIRYVGSGVVYLLGAVAQILAHAVGGDGQRTLVRLLNVCGGFPA